MELEPAPVQGLAKTVARKRKGKKTSEGCHAVQNMIDAYSDARVTASETGQRNSKGSVGELDITVSSHTPKLASEKRRAEHQISERAAGSLDVPAYSIEHGSRKRRAASKMDVSLPIGAEGRASEHQPLIANTNPINSDVAATLAGNRQTRANIEDEKTAQTSFYTLRCTSEASTQDPRCELEAAIEALAQQIRRQPTLPAEPSDATQPLRKALLEDSAPWLPPVHCAFSGCSWGWTGGADDERMLHLATAHRDELDKVARLLPMREDTAEDRMERMMAAYNEAIATVARGGAPLASYAIDRRSIYAYTDASTNGTIETLICWCCARRWPWMQARAINEISWSAPFATHDTTTVSQVPWTFYGMRPKATKDMFSLDAYLERYGGSEEDGPDLRNRPGEFDDWTMQLGSARDATRIICCPEDKKCSAVPEHAKGVCCERCEVPLCLECENHLRRPRPVMPPAALANDLMIYYAPRELYTRSVTVMEMICASPCLTTMICFSLEKKYRQHRSLDQEVHNNSFRIAARGNVTSFPLPWQDLLQELRGHVESEDAAEVLDLPHTGSELSNFVSILLKTSDGDDTTENLASFIHQATVRRDVVIDLIEGAKRRGHRAYRGVNLERMRAKATQLPQHGVPPELIKLLPYDSDIDKLQVQKAATPVDKSNTLEETARAVANSKPNGVVLEKSSYDDADINTQRVAALRHFSAKLGADEADGASAQTGSESEEDEQRSAKAARINKENIDNADDSDASLAASSEAGTVDSRGEAERLSKVDRLNGQTAGCSRKRRTEEAKLSDKDAKRVRNERGEGKTVKRVSVTAHNQLIDQFEPWYFGVAFAFVFKYCVGMPDMPAFLRKARWRRRADAPRVEATEWMRIFARRVEGQVSRDWTFGFASWNFIFRSAVNLSRTVLTYDSAASEKIEGRLTAKDLQDGAIELCKGLRAKYIDVDGKKKAVAGDMTKLRYIPGLSAAARRLLINLEHTSRKLPGTQETRRQMRFDTNAYRVRYGVPIFVTFSPDEAHNLLMVRLSRLRDNDPVRAGKQEDGQQAGIGTHARTRPPTHSDNSALELGIPVEMLANEIPDYQQRRQILAQDPLASVDGFRLLVALAHEHLFGVRMCIHCPDCNNGENSRPCQDMFGSSAKPEGGIFGRVDAIYTSIEAQKSTGSLHAHSQVFVQCLHQHTPLVELFASRSGRDKELAEAYLRYKAHVCRQQYADVNKCTEAAFEEIESQWPRYESKTLLVERPEYQKRARGALYSQIQCDEEWLREYLESDVQKLQMHKQHHIHLRNEESGEREPLPGCRRKDKPAACKADFPRTKWIISKAVILCQGLLKQMDMAITGRRSKLGSLHGPMNHECLNGTHPALLAVQRFNSDVQLPYRFPIVEETHSCCDDCVDESKLMTIVEAAQCAQDAQAGYACDYCTKRQPMAFNEVKECCKGHITLSEKLGGEKVNYIGKRHVTRLMCDAYGKGVVRGQVENTNLRAYWKDNAVTAAESIRTCQTQAMFGREYVDVVETVCEKKMMKRRPIFGEIDARCKRKRVVTIRDVAMLYGQRPKIPAIWCLSPYEFTMYWEPCLLSYPLTEQDASNPKHHVELTDSGRRKLRARKQNPREEAEEMEAGIDYAVRDAGGSNWVAFPETPATAHFRHTWILRRRRRANAPSFAGAPIPRHRPGEAERAAMIIMTYFRAWTLRDSDADDQVPYCGKLRTTDLTWQESLQTWLDGGIGCEETKRYVGNFLSVYRIRPRDDEEDDRHTSDAASDEDLRVTASDLTEALRTKVGGRGRRDDIRGADQQSASDTDDDDDRTGGQRENSRAGMAVAQQIWCADAPENAKEPAPAAPGNIAEILAAARQSQRNEKSLTSVLDHHEAGSEVRKLTAATPGMVERWLKRLRKQKNEKGERYCNAEQYEFVSIVARRVIAEMRGQADKGENYGEPLRWCLHGGPGTGKTHALKIIRQDLFEGVLGWDMGVQFQMVALQAVMAELLGGDTIHHACGIPAFRKNDCHEDDLQRHLDVAKKVLQWRWLIIDEISMVSAKLFAEMDIKLRRVVREVGTQKLNKDGKERPFGGLNIICAGDLWQLDPPDGGFLGDIPTEFIQNARNIRLCLPSLTGRP